MSNNKKDLYVEVPQEEKGEANKNQNVKSCSICGKRQPHPEYSYGNRENRSYCKKCNKEEKAAYRQGGTEAARNYREEMRSTWKIA